MPVKAPKGVSNASNKNGVKSSGTGAASTVVLKKKSRKAHDPHRAIQSLPITKLICEDKFFNANQEIGKDLLIILACMAELSEYSLPISPKKINNKNNGQPVISTLDDFVKWVRSLSFDGGFLIVNSSGITGSGKIISRGSSCGKNIHVSSGGLTFANKKGAHTFFCGTINDRSAHVLSDLSDPQIFTIIPALIRLGVVSLPDDIDKKKQRDDDDIAFEETDELGADASFWVIVEAAKLINPDISFKIPKSIAQTKQRNNNKTKNETFVNYIQDKDLPTYDSDGQQKTSGVKSLNSAIVLNNEDSEDSDESEDDNKSDEDIRF
jgi:hypothetical protein